MGDLILRPSTLREDRPWALQLRFHECVGETEYYTLMHLTDETAFHIVDAGAPYFMFGDPREDKSSR